MLVNHIRCGKLLKEDTNPHEEVLTCVLVIFLMRPVHLTAVKLAMSSTTWRAAPASTPPHPQQRRPFNTIS